ncbi:MAG: hypothetical protein ACOH2I_05195 [Pseudomonas sp.]
MGRSTGLLKVFVCCLLLLTLSIPLTATFAAGGDIVLSRQVQPRVATRQAMVPDPNPRVVNPSPNRIIGDTLLGGTAGNNELNDHDFARVSSGLALPQNLNNANYNAPIFSNSIPTQSSSGAAASQSGGMADNVAGQVNRSVQQGLLPLQIIGGH